jgi:hypothetical protein
MSIRSASDRNTFAGVADPTIRLAFVGNVHRLLSLGYARLDSPKYCNANENLLNQDLVASLRAVTQERQPRWACHFAIHEKQKHNDDEREGNDRLELDIVLERTQRGPHPMFILEAKRLGPSHPIKTYLGPEGLAAYVSCEYANEHDDAGMLGYVQSKTVATWCASLETELGVSPGNNSVETTGKWQRHTFREGTENTFRTRHTRKSKRGPITIYHTLLDFTGPDASPSK